MRRLGSSLMVALVGCAAASPPRQKTEPTRAAPASSVSSVASGADAGVAEASPIDPAMESKLTEYRRFRDWRNTVLAKGQPPEESVVRPRAIVQRAALPKPASIRAYAHDSQACRTKSPFGVPFEADGTLCSGVVPPSAALTAGEVARVLSLMNAANAELVEIFDKKKPKRPVVRCDFLPHHELVYFDEAGSPIARIEVSFSCHQFRWDPASRPALMGRWEPPLMTPEERKILADIFDAHDLGARTYDDDEVDELLRYERRVYGTPHEPTPLGKARRERRLAEPSGLPPGLSAKRASARDHELFCTWLAGAFREGGARPSGEHYQCLNGLEYSTEVTRDTCERRLASCDVTLGRLEACLRHITGGPEQLCSAAFPKDCEGLEGCIPGVTVRPLRGAER